MTESDVKRPRRLCKGFLLQVALDEWEGKTMDETAERLHCNVQTVRRAKQHSDYEEIGNQVQAAIVNVVASKRGVLQ